MDCADEGFQGNCWQLENAAPSQEHPASLLPASPRRWIRPGSWAAASQEPKSQGKSWNFIPGHPCTRKSAVPVKLRRRHSHSQRVHREWAELWGTHSIPTVASCRPIPSSEPGRSVAAGLGCQGVRSFFSGWRKAGISSPWTGMLPESSSQARAASRQRGEGITDGRGAALVQGKGWISTGKAGEGKEQGNAAGADSRLA